MLVFLGDTHGERSHRLEGRTLEAVRNADHVCHTGDFTTEAVYEAIEAEAGGAPLTAVHGNSDSQALKEKLPARATVTYEDLTLVVVHGHEHDETSLSFLARQENADVVIVGHTHRPVIRETPHALVVNPGSHADPPGATASHGELTHGERGMAIEVRAPYGSPLSEASFSTEGR